MNLLSVPCGGESLRLLSRMRVSDASEQQGPVEYVIAAASSLVTFGLVLVFLNLRNCSFHHLW